MKITIEIEPKELAALVLELQEQPEIDVIAAELAKKIKKGATSMQNLNQVPTKDLVEELLKREGAEQTIAEPYQDVIIKQNGPAIILVVTD